MQKDKKKGIFAVFFSLITVMESDKIKESNFI